ncbi:hypothetical protein [Actinoplanes missouriensis]|nr:hypothetical protein [Actinoplanes missouriensis]
MAALTPSHFDTLVGPCLRGAKDLASLADGFRQAGSDDERRALLQQAQKVAEQLSRFAEDAKEELARSTV